MIIPIIIEDTISDIPTNAINTYEIALIITVTDDIIEGFVAGALGIIVTLILCVPANAIIKNVTSIANVAQLPVAGGVILVIISMLLTLIAGLIPARLAAKKDPVVALRSE